MTTGTAIEAGCWFKLLCGVFILAALTGCQPKTTTTSASDVQDQSLSCLERFDSNTPAQLIADCTTLIEDNSRNPQLFRDRSLLFMLNGQQKAACLDVTKALALLQRIGPGEDPLLRHELTVRDSICRQSRTMAGSD